MQGSPEAVQGSGYHQKKGQNIERKIKGIKKYTESGRHPMKGLNLEQ